MQDTGELLRPYPCRTGSRAAEAGVRRSYTDPTITPAAIFALPGAQLRPLDYEGAGRTDSTDGRRALLLGAAYLLVLGLIELLCAAVGPVVPFLGPAFFGAALLLLLVHAGLCWGRPLHYLPLALAALPALRLVLLLRPAGSTPLLAGLAWGFPVLLAAAVILRLFGGVPGWGSVVARTGDIAQAVADLVRQCRADFQGRLSPYGTALLLLPAIAAFLAVGAGVLVARLGSFPASAAGLPGSSGLSAARLGVQEYPVLFRAPGPWSDDTGLTLVEMAAIRDVLRAALARPLRALFRVTPGENGGIAKPEYLSLRSDARQPRLVGAIVMDPGSANLRLGWEDEVALIPLWGEATPPAALHEADDALVPRFAPRLFPRPVSLVEAYPDCPSSSLDNPYPRGVCTWYAKDRRPDLAGFWGENGLAINWPRAAAACGYRVDGVPAAGAVIVFPPGANGAYEGGHVGYVEAVEEDALLISECNVTHDSAGIVEPRWSEAGYSCAFRRIPWARLSPRVQYIHGWQEPAPPPPAPTLELPFPPVPREGLALDG
jgi:surface antigen